MIYLFYPIAQKPIKGQDQQTDRWPDIHQCADIWKIIQSVLGVTCVSTSSHQPHGLLIDCTCLFSCRYFTNSQSMGRWSTESIVSSSYTSYWRFHLFQSKIKYVHILFRNPRNLLLLFLEIFTNLSESIIITR